MSADTSSSENCPICKDSLSDGEVVQVHQKGADGINAASVQRGDSLVVTAGCNVHALCWVRYIDKKNIQLSKCVFSPVETRRSEHLSAGPFKSDSDCLFYGRHVTPGDSDYSYVRTDTFTRTIMKCCESHSDDWSLKVKGRIEFYGGDLHAADCIYHRVCSVNFRNGYDVPRQYRDDSSGSAKKHGKFGHPTDADQEQAFLRMCDHLERNDEGQFTISELEEKMREFLNCDDLSPYSNILCRVPVN